MIRLLDTILSPSRTLISHNFYTFFSAQVHSSSHILNIGSGDSTRLGSRLFYYLPHHVRVTHLDCVDSPRVDIVSNAECMPIPDSTYDLVICQALVEHVEDPQRMLDEISRVLKPSGLLYITFPFLQGFHPDPLDFRRFSQQGLYQFLTNYLILTSGTSSGPFSAISWILRDLFTIGPKASSLYNTSRLFSSLLFVPISYLDYFFSFLPGFHRNASEYFAFCRKI